MSAVRSVAPLRLCANHKLELWKRGYGTAEAIALAVPTVYRKALCLICNGTWSLNQQLSRNESGTEAE